MSPVEWGASRPWRQSVGPATSVQAWALILGLLAIVGLLLAFLHVLQGNALQAASRHAADAARAEATWRCNAPQGQRQCDAAMSQAGALPHLAVSMIGR